MLIFSRETDVRLLPPTLLRPFAALERAAAAELWLALLSLFEAALWRAACWVLLFWREAVELVLWRAAAAEPL